MIDVFKVGFYEDLVFFFIQMNDNLKDFWIMKYFYLEVVFMECSYCFY